MPSQVPKSLSPHVAFEDAAQVGVRVKEVR
jgi:hypothetical protein